MKMPYFTSDFYFNKEIIDQYQCGIYMDPEDVDAVAGAVRLLIDNKEKSRIMGENGRKLVEEKFNWSVDEKRLFELYERLYREKTGER